MTKQLAAAVLAVALATPGFAQEVSTLPSGPSNAWWGWASGTAITFTVVFFGATIATHYKWCAANPKCYNAQRDGLPR